MPIKSKNENKIKKLIAKTLCLNISDVILSANLIDDLGADSLDLTDLVMSMEEEFDIEISAPDAEEILTVKDAIEYINNRIL